MVEFDTVNGANEGMDRPTGGNHVGLNVNNIISVANRPAAYFTAEDVTEHIDMNGDVPIQAWIDYDGSNQTVNVTISYIGRTKPQWPLITHQINSSSLFLPNMYAGFSAATGNNDYSSRFILGWTFRLNGPANPLNESRLPTVPNSPFSSSNNRLRNALITTFSIILFLLLGALTSTLLYRRVMNFEALED